MKSAWVFLMLGFLVTIGSRSCVEQPISFDAVDRLVEEARPIIVDALYGGGDHIRSEMLSFNFNNLTQSWRIDLRIVWPQGMPGRDLFWCEGALVAGLEEDTLQWTAKKMSHNLRRRLDDLRLNKGDPGRTAIVLKSHPAMVRPDRDKSEI